MVSCVCYYRSECEKNASLKLFHLLASLSKNRALKVDVQMTKRVGH